MPVPVVWVPRSSLLPQTVPAFPMCELALLGQYYYAGDLREFRPLPNLHGIADFELASREARFEQVLSPTEELCTIGRDKALSLEVHESRTSFWAVWHCLKAWSRRIFGSRSPICMKLVMSF